MKLIENKKLGLTYTVEEKLSAGVELFGFEVKSLRNKLGSVEGARVIIRGGEAFVVGMYIPAYQPANTPKNYDEHRTRRLLLTKKELSKMASIEQAKTLTLIPSSLYLSHRLIKCEIALCKKKQAHDKRETIKKDIARRELRSSL
jgi:SsrA-binding protein